MEQAKIGTSGEFQKKKFIDSIKVKDQTIERIVAFEPVYRLTQDDVFEILPNKTAISTSTVDGKLLAADIVSSKYLFFPNNIFSDIAYNMNGELSCDLFTQNFRGSIILDNCMIKIANAHNGSSPIRISPTINVENVYVPIFLPTSHIHLGNVEVTKYIIDETMKVTKSLSTSTKHIEQAMKTSFAENAVKISNLISSKTPEYIQITLYNSLNNTNVTKENFTLLKNNAFPNSPIDLTSKTPLDIVKFFVEDAPKTYQQKRAFSLAQQVACEKIVSTVMDLAHIRSAITKTFKDLNMDEAFQDAAKDLVNSAFDKTLNKKKIKLNF